MKAGFCTEASDPDSSCKQWNAEWNDITGQGMAKKGKTADWNLTIFFSRAFFDDLSSGTKDIWWVPPCRECRRFLSRGRSKSRVRIAFLRPSCRVNPSQRILHFLSWVIVPTDDDLECLITYTQE
jgi:hypothetical protein